MRYFEIKWAEKVKFGKPCERSTRVTTPGNAQSALMHVCAVNGNLKKIDIISIQEYNKDWKEKIGEPIVPEEDSKIVPVG